MILLPKYIQEKRLYFLKYAVMIPKAMFHFTHWDSAIQELGSSISIYVLWQCDSLKIMIICFFNQHLTLKNITNIDWKIQIFVSLPKCICYSHTYNV